MNLPKKSNLVFDHRYFLGSLRDFSGNNNSGVGTGISFQKKSDKHVVFEGTDKITISIRNHIIRIFNKKTVKTLNYIFVINIDHPTIWVCNSPRIQS